MMCSESIINFVVLVLLTGCDGKSYKNHALLRGVPYDYEELVFYKKLDKLYNVTWWKKPTMVHKSVQFSITPRSLAKLYRDTEKMTVRFSVMIKNIQSAFDKQKTNPYIRRNMQSFNWHSYYRLEDIYEWLKDLSTNHPDEVQLRRVGKTHENRTILGVRLRLKGADKRSWVIVEGGSHAREWISPAFVTYMLFTLLNAKEYKDEELEHVAHNYTWLFVPVMNPDGYEYSHTTDRLWRKNRRLGGGVDLNRNYASAFGYNDASKDPSNGEYCGPSAFSEPESYAMAKLAYEHKQRLEYYLSFHSYGQYIIIPYTYMIEHEGNYDKVKEMADKAAQRISENHGIQYKTGNSFDTLGYLASGVSIDWVKRAVSVPYAVAIELPDTGVHGFALPPGRILPTCQATMDGLLSFLAPRNRRLMRTVSAARENQVFVRILLLSNVFLYIMNTVLNSSCSIW